MINISPLARAKRVHSISDVLSLYRKNELLVQQKLKGTSCHIIVGKSKISIFNRVGFDITEQVYNKSSHSILETFSKNRSFHFLAVIKNKKIVIYDMLKEGDNNMTGLSLDQRLKILKDIDINEKFVKSIETYGIENYSKNIEPESEIIFKDRNSKYPVQNLRGKEVVADWFSYSPTRLNEIDVIVDSYTIGSSPDDFVFKCKQFSRNKQIYVGKLRIENKKQRNIIASLVDNRKRAVCKIFPGPIDKNKKFKSGDLIERVFDKPFSSVQVSKERYLSNVRVINMSTREVQFLTIDN